MQSMTAKADSFKLSLQYLHGEQRKLAIVKEAIRRQATPAVFAEALRLGFVS